MKQILTDLLTTNMKLFMLASGFVALAFAILMSMFWSLHGPQSYFEDLFDATCFAIGLYIIVNAIICALVLFDTMDKAKE